MRKSYILQYIRNDYGREIRKQYEAHDKQAAWSEMRTVRPRRDDLCNTITTVLKDNLILEVEEMEVKRLGNINGYTGGSFAGNVYGTDGISPTLNAMQGGGRQPMIVEEKTYRLRKFTPKECFRFMGFTDEEFEKAEKVNSNTQLYKQAGNSIVVDVLVAIFDNLLIQGRSAWLDELLSEKEDKQ